jgi:gamma-glutamyl-gamma-aminobutyrate hydrolase PuuD
MVKRNKKIPMHGRIAVYTDGIAASTWLDHTKFIAAPNVKAADIVVFGGGFDLDPSLYKEKKGSFTRESQFQDKRDLDKFEECISEDKFMVGICRGAQFLAVQAGATLIQDMSGHKNTHHSLSVSYDFLQNIDNDIVKAVYKDISVNSNHHQMVHPLFFAKNKKKAKLIAYSEQALSLWYLDADDKMINFSAMAKEDNKIKEFEHVEPEVFWFPEIKGLGFQYHPERLSASNSGQSTALDFTTSLIIDIYEQTLKK